MSPFHNNRNGKPSDMERDTHTHHLLSEGWSNRLRVCMFTPGSFEQLYYTGFRPSVQGEQKDLYPDIHGDLYRSYEPLAETDQSLHGQ
jgi:hypothetical protein